MNLWSRIWNFVLFQKNLGVPLRRKICSSDSWNSFWLRTQRITRSNTLFTWDALFRLVETSATWGHAGIYVQDLSGFLSLHILRAVVFSLGCTLESSGELWNNLDGQAAPQNNHIRISAGEIQAGQCFLKFPWWFQRAAKCCVRGMTAWSTDPDSGAEKDGNAVSYAALYCLVSTEKLFQFSY